MGHGGLGPGVLLAPPTTTAIPTRSTCRASTSRRSTTRSIGSSVPLRQRVIAAAASRSTSGSSTWTSGQSAFEHWQNPAGVRRVHAGGVPAHAHRSTGSCPNGIDVVNEPDNVADWTTDAAIGQAIVATAREAAGAGFAVPEFIAPSYRVSAAAPSVDRRDHVPCPARRRWSPRSASTGIRADLASLQAVAARAVQLGKRTSMLEYWATARQPTRTIRAPGSDRGRNVRVAAGRLRRLPDHGSSQLDRAGERPSRSPVPIAKFTAAVHQVRPARRAAHRRPVGQQPFEPLAFVNTNGRLRRRREVLHRRVVHGERPAGGHVRDLLQRPSASSTVNLPDVAIAAGQGVGTRIQPSA